MSEAGFVAAMRAGAAPCDWRSGFVGIDIGRAVSGATKEAMSARTRSIRFTRTPFSLGRQERELSLRIPDASIIKAKGGRLGPPDLKLEHNLSQQSDCWQPGQRDSFTHRPSVGFRCHLVEFDVAVSRLDVSRRMQKTGSIVEKLK